jgi:hypothetical protein
MSFGGLLDSWDSSWRGGEGLNMSHLLRGAPEGEGGGGHLVGLVAQELLAGALLAEHREGPPEGEADVRHRAHLAPAGVPPAAHLPVSQQSAGLEGPGGDQYCRAEGGGGGLEPGLGGGHLAWCPPNGGRGAVAELALGVGAPAFDQPRSKRSACVPLTCQTTYTNICT